MFFSSVSISFPQSAGQLLEEHFPKRMMQHSKWPRGRLCSNLNQKSLTLSDGYLAVLVKGVHRSSSAPLGLLTALDQVRTELATVQRAVKVTRQVPIHMANPSESQLPTPHRLNRTHGLTCPGCSVRHRVGYLGISDCPVITHIRPPKCLL